MSICIATKGIVCGRQKDTRPIVVLRDDFLVEVQLSESYDVEVVDLTEAQIVGVSSESEAEVSVVSESEEIQVIYGELQLDIEE